MGALTALPMRLASHGGLVIGACWRGAVGPRIPLGENRRRWFGQHHQTQATTKVVGPAFRPVLELLSKPSEE
jgi:hypothetical protein